MGHTSDHTLYETSLLKLSLKTYSQGQHALCLVLVKDDKECWFSFLFWIWTGITYVVQINMPDNKPMDERICEGNTIKPHLNSLR